MVTFIFIQGVRFLTAGMYTILLQSQCTNDACFSTGEVLPYDSGVWHEAPCHLSSTALCKVTMLAGKRANSSNIQAHMHILPSATVPAYSSSLPSVGNKWLQQPDFLQYILQHPCKKTSATGRKTILFHHTTADARGHEPIRFIHDITLCDLLDTGLVIAFMPQLSRVFLLYDNRPTYIYIVMAVAVVYLTVAVSNDLVSFLT